MTVASNNLIEIELMIDDDEDDKEGKKTKRRGEGESVFNPCRCNDSLPFPPPEKKCIFSR
jgi:hypothetical protein